MTNATPNEENKMRIPTIDILTKIANQVTETGYAQRVQIISLCEANGLDWKSPSDIVGKVQDIIDPPAKIW